MGARVHLCGRLQVEWDGERLEGALPGRQGRLLFAFLTLHRDRLVRRDELVEALWSEEGPPPGGDALLRPPLSRLRSALGPGRLEGRGELAVRFPEDTWIDREAVRDGLRAEPRARYGAGDARASWEAARRRWRSPSAGCCPGSRRAGCEPFRAELEEQRVELLEAVALAGARLGDGELRGGRAGRAPRRSRPRRFASRRGWRCSRCCAGAATWPRRWWPSTSSGRSCARSSARRRAVSCSRCTRSWFGPSPAGARRGGPPRAAGGAGAAAPGSARPGAGRPVGGTGGGARAGTRTGGPGGRGRGRARARRRRGRHRQDAAGRRAGRRPRRLRRPLRALRRGGDLPVRPVGRHAAAAPRAHGRRRAGRGARARGGRPGTARAGDPRAPAGRRRRRAAPAIPRRSAACCSWR